MTVATEKILKAALGADDGVSDHQIVQALAVLKGNQIAKVAATVLLLRQAEAARLLNCSRFTIRRLEQQGVLTPVFLTPDLKRYRLADLQALAAGGTARE
jgi:hypothetical protein